VNTGTQLYKAESVRTTSPPSFRRYRYTTVTIRLEKFSCYEHKLWEERGYSLSGPLNTMFWKRIETLHSITKNVNEWWRTRLKVLWSARRGDFCMSEKLNVMFKLLNPITYDPPRFSTKKLIQITYCLSAREEISCFSPVWLANKRECFCCKGTVMTSKKRKISCLGFCSFQHRWYPPLAVLGLLHVFVENVPKALPARLRDQDGVSKISLHLQTVRQCLEVRLGFWISHRAKCHGFSAKKTGS
jgi:hypothetical protein